MTTFAVAAVAVDYVRANCFESDFVDDAAVAADVAEWRYVADY
jgi:hypothetical protein